MPVKCEECGHRYLLGPDHLVTEIGCENCGSDQVYRDQVSPTRSDMEQRDMVDNDPGWGQDMGGNPLKEGILGDGGWQNRKVRDESFASVREAAQQAQATPSLPAGIHFGTMPALQFVGATVNGMPPGNDLYKWTVNEWLPQAREGNPQPVTVEVQNDHPAYLAAAVAIVNNSSACNGKLVPVPEFKNLVMGIKSGEVPPPQKTASVHHSFDVDDFGFGDEDEDTPTPTHKFIVDAANQVYSLPEPTHHEDIAEANGLISENFPAGLSLGLLNSDGSTEWYQHHSGQAPADMAQALQAHFGQEITVDPELKPSTSEERFGIPTGVPTGEARLPSYDRMKQMEQQAVEMRGRPYGYYDNPFFNRGGHVFAETLDQDIVYPWTHFDMQKDAALPFALAPAAPAIGAGLGAAARFLGPKLLAPALRGAVQKGGKPLAQKGLQAIKNAPKAAWKGLGTAAKLHALGTILGGGFGGGGAGGNVAPTQQLRGIQQLGAEYQHPSSVPEIGAKSDDPQAVDPHEINVGDHTNWGYEYQVNDMGGTDDPHAEAFDEEVLERVLEVLPTILHYHESEESGLDDPTIRELHDLLEKKSPGFFKEAQGPPPLATPSTPPNSQIIQNAPQNNPAAAHPMSGRCQNCGATLNADGSCPQCGAYSQNTPAMQTDLNRQPSVQVPGQLQPGRQAAHDHQGPRNSEQFAMVAEFLHDNGRSDEIITMLRQPWQYAEELAAVQNDVNAPPIDQSAPAAPTPPPAPVDPNMGMPGAGGPPGMDPAQAIAAAVKKAADPVAPRCPNCGSATTGLLNTDGDARCHRCKHTWKVKEVMKEKTSETHEHVEKDSPIIEAGPDVQDTPSDSGEKGRWTDAQGEPLQVGQEYEMHSENYSIPDIIRVEAVKPSGIEFTIESEYGLQHRAEVSREEIEMEGLTFQPTDAGIEDSAESPEPDLGIEQNMDDDPRPAPGETTDLSTPHEKMTSHEAAEEPIDPDLAWLKEDSSGPIPHIAGAKFTPMEQREFIDEDGEARNKDRLNLSGTHYEVRSHNGNGLNAPEDHLFLGL